MGAAISRIAKRLGFLPQCRLRIPMVGLDASGKTTILYKLKLGDLLKTKPTTGFNAETIEYKNRCFDVWDIGGQSKIRPLWKYYFPNAQGIIFVVDSSDRERISEARKELHWILADNELANAPLLVFANKQDLSNAMTSSEIAATLGLHCLGQRPGTSRILLLTLVVDSMKVSTGYPTISQTWQNHSLTTTFLILFPIDIIKTKLI